MSELWKAPTMEVTYVELVGLIERSDFYHTAFEVWNGETKTTSIDVSFCGGNQKKYFDFSTLKSVTEKEALKAASNADKLVMYIHQSIFDEADDRRAILEECLEMEHIDIKIGKDFYQKLDDGLWEVNGDDENVVPSTTVYHDLFDFTKPVRLVK